MATNDKPTETPGSAALIAIAATLAVPFLCVVGILIAKAVQP